MAQGTLEVLLVGAKGLENTDYLCKLPWASPFPHRILICLNSALRFRPLLDQVAR